MSVRMRAWIAAMSIEQLFFYKPLVSLGNSDKPHSRHPSKGPYPKSKREQPMAATRAKT
jgi:hypothetical protein